MSLRIGRICAADGPLVEELFCRIRNDPTARRFHPHPFTDAEALAKALYSGPDLYALLVYEQQPIGYGLLRGWEEGFTVPSLGIYISNSHRGSGAARLLMEYLHLAAKLMGCPAVRLKVYPDNPAAVALYRGLGYRFADGLEEGQIVGRLEL